MRGWGLDLEAQCLTLFSAPQYCGAKNAAAVLLLPAGSDDYVSG